MQIYQHLYVSESLKKRATSVVQKILDGGLLLDVYVIVLTAPSKNRLEIYNIALDRQRLFHMGEVLLVGIARGQEEALELITQITEEVYQETGDADLIEYIKQHQLED